jgi:membrane dipeptidase
MVKFIRKLNILLILISISLLSCKNRSGEKTDEELRHQALKICENNLILDSHIDWPEWLLDYPEDISRRISLGDFDLERSKEGGLNAALSVVYIPPKLNVDESRRMVDTLLGMINGYAIKYPDKFAFATNPVDVTKNFRKNLFSMIPCLENGSPIGNDMDYLKYLKNQGIAYITLCHSKVNQISDSNFDSERKWNGLSPFGKELIREMNRLGIMIDISHSSDSTVYQALRLSAAPIIASHSSCRYFVPGFERNLPDTLIKAIAEKGGIIMVNLCSAFLDSACSNSWNYLYAWSDSTGTDLMSKEGIEFTSKYGKTHKLYSDSKKVADHIDHIIRITGDIDHVGIGSDYDGIGFMQPSDLPDVSSYPVIVYELLKRGYKENDIIKILSGNFLRVWDTVLKSGDSKK